MNPTDWLDTTFAVRLTLALAHFLWQGCVVALLVFGAAGLLRRRSANLRYVVHLAALLLLMACLPVTFALMAAPETAGESEKIGAAPPMQQTVAQRNSVEALVAEESASPANGSTADHTGTQASVPPLERMAPFLTGLYVLGVALMLARLTWLLWGGHRLRRGAKAIDNELLGLIKRKARRVGLKAAPAVAWCGRVSVPVVVGLIKPMILLPTSLASGLGPSQLEALLLHELAHIGRYDVLVNLMQRLAEALLFFHPAVWYLSGRLSVEREHACDDFVLAAGCGRVAYADALVRMAELCADAAPGRLSAPAALLSAAGSSRSQFHRRVLRLLEAESHPKLRLTRGGLVAVLLLAAVAFTPVLLTSRAQAPSDSPNATLGGELVVQVEEVLNQDAAGEESGNEQTDVPQEQRHRRDRDQQSAESQIPGFDLADYPSTLEAVTIRDLYRPDPDNPGRYRSAGGVLTIPIYTARNYAILKYPVRLKRFYVQVRAPKGGRRTYGPIEGDPFQRLKLDEAIRAKLRTADRRPADALLRLRGMLSVGDDALRARAFAMMDEIPQPAYRDRHTLDSLIETAADALEDLSDLRLVAGGQSALERVEQLAADAKAEWQQRRVKLDEGEYAAGESGDPGPSIVWGQPAENGMQLGISPDLEPAVWEFERYYDGTLWVRNTGKEPVKFTSTSRTDEGVRLWLVGQAGERHESRIGGNTSWLVPLRYRLEPGQWAKLKKVWFCARRAVPNDTGRPPVGRFSVEPGRYALEVELRIAAFESYDAQGNVDVPAAGEWTGKLTAKSAASIAVGANAGEGTTQRERSSLDMHVAGVCRRAEDDAPVAGAQARLYVYRRDPSRLEFFKSARTDQDGKFVIEATLTVDDSADPQRSRISVSAPGRATRVLFWQPDAAYDPPVQLKLRSPASLKGRAVGPDGEPVAGAVVYAGGPWMKGVRDAITDEEGRFEIDDMETWDSDDSESFLHLGNLMHVVHADYGKETVKLSAVPSTVDVRLSYSTTKPRP